MICPWLPTDALDNNRAASHFQPSSPWRGGTTLSVVPTRGTLAQFSHQTPDNTGMPNKVRHQHVIRLNCSDYFKRRDVTPMLRLRQHSSLQLKRATVAEIPVGAIAVFPRKTIDEIFVCF